MSLHDVAKAVPTPQPLTSSERLRRLRLLHAARALIGMTQINLARASGVGVSTVTDFELGSRQVSPMMVNEIAEALERAGIEFSRDGVSLRRRSAG